jgi:hypothetical protein
MLTHSVENNPQARLQLSNGKCLAILLIGVLTVGSGCGESHTGPATAHLRGTVTIGGKFLPADVESNVTIRPTVSGQARTVGVPVIDGKYDCPNAPIGAVKVYISIQQRTGKVIHRDDGSDYPELKNIASPEYGLGIKMDVTGDNLSQDFDVKSS